MKVSIRSHKMQPAHHDPMTPKVVLLTNIPAPYRIPTLNLFASSGQLDLTVIFCAGREPNRDWDLPPFEFKTTFLREAFHEHDGKYIHNNFQILGVLAAARADVIITTAFHPTFLYAYAYAIATGTKHICMTDGTLESESKLSRVHRTIRALVFKGSAAFIGASDGSLRLYRSWNLDEDRIFKAPLCVENERFRETNKEPEYDLLFCGRFVHEKQPMFAIEVAERTASLLGRPVSLLFVGSGDLETKMRERARLAKDVICVFHGFAKQSELPSLYANARIFLFPTLGDVWGIVASEACAAGLPIICTQYAGAAGEIIKEGINGFIISLDAKMWALRACSLLSDPKLRGQMSAQSRIMVAGHNHHNAAAAVRDAVFRALKA